ncbi:hypothetical protein ACFL5O_11340 [Myxococcota bacterium]
MVIRKPVILMAQPGHKVVIRPLGEAHSGLSIQGPSVTVRGIDLQGFRRLGVSWEDSARNTLLADMEIRGSEEGIATMATRLDGLLAFNLRVAGASTIGLHCGEGPCRN